MALGSAKTRLAVRTPTPTRHLISQNARVRLDTKTQPRKKGRYLAHAGVSFDVVAGKDPLEVLALHVGGELGTLRVLCTREVAPACKQAEAMNPRL